MYVRVDAAKPTFLVTPTRPERGNELNAKFKYLKSDINDAPAAGITTGCTLNAIFPSLKSARVETLPTGLTITAALIALSLITSVVVNYYYHCRPVMNRPRKRRANFQGIIIKVAKTGGTADVDPISQGYPLKLISLFYNRPPQRAAFVLKLALRC